jgi:preprotein translocase subunit SecD
MNWKSLILLILIVAVIGVGIFFGYKPLTQSFRLGLDVKGGVSILLEAVPGTGEKLTSDVMERTVAVLTNRVNGMGVAEATVVREGTNRIRVSLPDYENQEEAMAVIGKTAKLEFRDDSGTTGKYTDGKVFLTGEHLKDAREQFDQSNGQNAPVVTIELDDAGGKIMQDYTSSRVGSGFMVITLDGQPISIPRIDAAVGANGMISGLESIQAAHQLAILLRSGALPVNLEVRDFRAVGPSLGMSYLRQSLVAGLIGLALVLAFMFMYYRGLGFVADIALVAYVSLTLTALWAVKAAITLPGVAGIVLGIGMAVDANCIIFERIKDEYRNNKRSLGASVETGFHRAMATVVDSNVTTLIGAAVLYVFGTGPIRGFAVTLSISIVVSMITAVLLSHYLVRLLVSAGVRNRRVLGV